jgi:hypothetical protein
LPNGPTKCIELTRQRWQLWSKDGGSSSSALHHFTLCAEPSLPGQIESR